MTAAGVDVEEAHPASEASGAPSEASAAWASALRRFDRELRRQGAAERTRRAYGGDLARLATWAAAQGLAPADVRYLQLRRYAAELSSRQPPAGAIARTLAAIRAFYRMLIAHGEAPANPADLLGAPRLPRRLPRTLDAGDVAALLDRIPTSTPLEIRDRAIFELAYAAGLRAEELVALDVEDVDVEAAQVRVERRERTARVVPAGDPAMRSLARYLERARPALAAGDRRERALFLSKTGRRLSTSDVRRRLRSWARHAATQGAVDPHTLRQSLATHLVDGGADLRGLPETLEHASLPAARVYTRVESERLRAAYARSHPRA